MYVKKSRSSGRIYLSFVEGYRKDGKVKQRTIEKIGWLDELEKYYDDPVEHFRKIARERTDKRADKKADEKADQTAGEAEKEPAAYDKITKAPQQLFNARMEEVSLPEESGNVEVYCDEYRRNAANISHEHWHHTFQFTVMLKGSMAVSINGAPYYLREGEGIFFNSNVLHCMNKDNRCRGRSCTVHISPASIFSEKEISLYSRYVMSVLNTASCSHIIFSPERDWHRKVLGYLREMLKEADRQEYGYELQLKNLIGQIWVEILRNQPLSVSTKEEEKRAVKAERLKKMMVYVQENYSRKLSVKDIAEAVNVSESECRRCFQEILHQTPVEYITEVRIAEACRLLSDKELTAVAVSSRCGFDDPSYFYRIFGKYMGMTPGEYRDGAVFF